MVPLAGWCNEEVTVSRPIALESLAMERRICDLISWTYLAYYVLSKPEASTLSKAKHTAALRRFVNTTEQSMTTSRKMLGDVALKRSGSFYGQVVENIAALASTMEKLVLSDASGALMCEAQKIDGLIPRWGAFLSDSGIDKELVRLQLVENAAMRQLPASVRTLASTIASTRAIAAAMSIEKPAEHALLKDSMRIAGNSFDFSRKTVNVAAAAKLLFLPIPTAQKTVDMVLKFRDALPKSMVRILESIKSGKTLDDSDEGAPDSRKAPKRSAAARASGRPAKSTKATKAKPAP